MSKKSIEITDLRKVIVYRAGVIALYDVAFMKNLWGCLFSCCRRGAVFGFLCKQRNEAVKLQPKLIFEVFYAFVVRDEMPYVSEAFLESQQA